MVVLCTGMIVKVIYTKKITTSKQKRKFLT